jgi:hypothetical protein
MLSGMSEHMTAAQIARTLSQDPQYRQALTAQLTARTIDDQTMRELLAYARSRQATMGQAMVRSVLTDAGVSWEAV